MTSSKCVSLALLVICPAALTAQTIAIDKVNGYFAPVTIVADHLQCDGAGEVALLLSLEAQDLQFRLEGAHPRDVAFAGGQWPLLETYQGCYVTQRVAGQATRVEIPCGDRVPPDGSAMSLQRQEMTLDLSGTVTLCQSLTGARLLDGDWIANFALGGNEVTYAGGYSASIREYCEARDNRTAAVAGLIHSASGLVGDAWGTAAQADSVYQLRLREVRLDKAQTGGSEITVSTDVSFFPSLDGATSCHEGVCGTVPSEPVIISRPIGLDHDICG